MKQIIALFIVAFGCSLAQAADATKPTQQSRMSLCQKEATASGKKGKERSEVLRGCLAAGKKTGKEAKPA